MGAVTASASPAWAGTTGSLGPRSLGVARARVGGQGVGIEAHLLAQFRQERPYVGAESVDQYGVGGHDVSFALRLAKCFTVDQQRLGSGFLHVHDRAELGGDLFFDVVALVEHERNTRACPVGPGGHDLVHDAEKLVGVGSADEKVVVSVEAAIEMKTAEAPDAQQ